MRGMREGLQSGRGGGNMSGHVTIDGRPVPIEGERNILEMIRKSGIDLPTFCYHSQLSVYGACRLCLVDIEGRGIHGACSTPPEPGLKVRTMTEEIREIRKISVELLLANHDQRCPTCARSANCQLQSLARQLGIDKVRFKNVHSPAPLDNSSPSLVRDPNKCVLCGDCVRVCDEIQSVGAIDFAFRGHEAAVVPSFGRQLADVECVNCGQCASACPTGALAPKPEMEEVWRLLHNPEQRVVVQTAPAVRVALGECFGMEPGSITSGQMVAALRRLGFDEVYDTSFAADLTVIEEGTEFLARKAAGVRIPLFTSCCPAWVKFAEQYYPELLPHLSTCRSPQQMFGSLAKAVLPARLGIAREQLKVVAIMPCTAKKFEAGLEKFQSEGQREVDHVLTTVELARMILGAGIRFSDLEPSSFDVPFGFTTGAGVLFGGSGGVTEAVLRFAVEKVTGKPPASVDFHEVRGESGVRSARIPLGEGSLKVIVVHGLSNARRVAEEVKAGTADFDLVEVMACPGGCIGGAGQPVRPNGAATRARAKSLFQMDKMLQLQKSQDNIFVTECYGSVLGQPGGPTAHELLHTHYQSRRRVAEDAFPLFDASPAPKVDVSVCLGTSCFLRGSESLLRGLTRHAEENHLENLVDIRGHFCFEKCDCGPSVTVNGTHMEQCTIERALEAVEEQLAQEGNHACHD
jgi:NADH-quinone oxidoreductase subunit G